MRLKGKTALVTAAGQGIGHASVLAMAAEGAEVWATDVNEALLARYAGVANVRTARLDVLDKVAVDVLVVRRRGLPPLGQHREHLGDAAQLARLDAELLGLRDEGAAGGGGRVDDVEDTVLDRDDVEGEQRRHLLEQLVAGQQQTGRDLVQRLSRTGLDAPVDRLHPGRQPERRDHLALVHSPPFRRYWHLSASGH